MNPAQWAIVVSLILFLGIVACLEIGYRMGRRCSDHYPGSAHEGIGVIEAAVFALLGLLLGFSFAGGMSRLDARRQLIVQEANDIGTAYLRLDELPASEQPAMRSLFREYIATRLRAYEKLPDLQAADAEIASAAQVQQEIWARAVIAGRADPTQNTARLLLPALNEMIDVTTARTIVLHAHLPSLIFALLMCVALLSGWLARYAMAKRKGRSWAHMLVYAAVISATVYVVLDLDYPRSGLIHLNSADSALIKLRDSIR